MNPTSSPEGDMQSAAKFFFSHPTFAVAGASSNPAKFGHKIFAWYLSHGFHAVPVNPGCSSIKVRGKEFQTAPSPSKLADPKNTALSVITPPPVTAELLKEAKQADIKAVWLQPGSFTEKDLDYAVKEFPGGAVGGFAEGTRGGEGWCVLVDGEAAMSAAAKEKL
jgi:predicted CoA-binding protein